MNEIKPIDVVIPAAPCIDSLKRDCARIQLYFFMHKLLWRGNRISVNSRVTYGLLCQQPSFNSINVKIR
jgi:hypothetical protein